MAMAEPSPMIVQLPSRPLNLDDVAELSAIHDAHRYELDEGNLLVMPRAMPSTLPHHAYWLCHRSGGGCRERLRWPPDSGAERSVWL